MKLNALVATGLAVAVFEPGAAKALDAHDAVRSAVGASVASEISSQGRFEFPPSCSPPQSKDAADLCLAMQELSEARSNNRLSHKTAIWTVASLFLGAIGAIGAVMASFAALSVFQTDRAWILPDGVSPEVDIPPLEADNIHGPYYRIGAIWKNFGSSVALKVEHYEGLVVVPHNFKPSWSHNRHPSSWFMGPGQVFYGEKITMSEEMLSRVLDDGFFVYFFGATYYHTVFFPWKSRTTKFCYLLTPVRDHTGHIFSISTTPKDQYVLT